jgi:hypothetical protein
MQFDPESAKFLYAQMESDELVRIAFLEVEYVDEARKLAKAELAQRGLGEVDDSTISRVRAELERQRTDELDGQLRGLESEDEIPSWRQSIRSKLAPHRDVLSWLAIALAVLFFLNSVFDWGVFALDGRKSKAIALAVLFLWVVFIAPTRREFKERLHARNENSQ